MNMDFSENVQYHSTLSAKTHAFGLKRGVQTLCIQHEWKECKNFNKKFRKSLKLHVPIEPELYETKQYLMRAYL